MIKRFIHILFLVVVAWLVGFGLFLLHIHTQPQHDMVKLGKKVDGIVVLTGGNMRVAQGLVMLHENRGKELLISGVGENIDLKNLLNAHSANSFMSDSISSITLGYEATDTRSNVDEAYRWAKERNFKSLLIVTAHYHMPRALLLFKKHMPVEENYMLFSQHVIPAEFKTSSWLINSSVLQLLANEYNKLLVTYVAG